MKHLLVILFVFGSIGISHSQCHPDRHNTTWFDAWMSCEKSMNPNNARGESHWILYDFGTKYKLSNFHFWNLNNPNDLNSGAKSIIFDYSIDGSDWLEFGKKTFQMATGKSFYEGVDAFDFGKITARYLLLTIDENWGGNCYGFSELRVDVDIPNAIEVVDYDFNCVNEDGITFLSWKNSSEPVSFNIEKSDDNENWKTIEFIQNTEILNSGNNFKYNINSSKEAYYRIKVLEPNGEIHISNSHLCAKNTLQVLATPNPFTEDFTLEIVSKNNKPIVCVLSNVYGQTIKKKIINPHSIISILKFENITLASGNYFISVKQGQDIAHLKLVKLDMK